MNDRFCQISKYSREKLIGRDVRTLDFGAQTATFMRDLWTTIDAGRIWHGELHNRTKDGSAYWVDTTIVPFLNGRGEPYQYMAIQADITAQKRGSGAAQSSHARKARRDGRHRRARGTQPARRHQCRSSDD